MNWIPVTERFPDSETVVLVHAPGASEPVWLAWFDDMDGEWAWIEGAQIAEQVTHWMSLPEPPSDVTT